MIVRFLRMAGFDVAVSADLGGLVKASSYAMATFEDPHVRFAPLGIRGTDLVISNDASRETRASKFLHLDFNIFSPNSYAPGSLFFPICFHPDYLNAATFAAVKSHPLTEPRAIPIFFAGNFEEECYDRVETRRLFGLLSRDGMIRSLRARYGGGVLREPQSIAELTAGIAEGSYRKRIVLCHTKKFRIDGRSWFKILGNSDFALSPPGIGHIATIPWKQWPLAPCQSFNTPHTTSLPCGMANSASPSGTSGSSSAL